MFDIHSDFTWGKGIITFSVHHRQAEGVGAWRQLGNVPNPQQAFFHRRLEALGPMSFVLNILSLERELVVIQILDVGRSLHLDLVLDDFVHLRYTQSSLRVGAIGRMSEQGGWAFLHRGSGRRQLEQFARRHILLRYTFARPFVKYRIQT
jgi:hypothetical protein